MTMYFVTYDLNTPGKDYDALYKALKSLGRGYCHPVESVWFVGSDMDASGPHKYLVKHIDNNDKLIVMETSKNSTWSKNVGESNREWLRKYIWRQPAAA